jgi:hypothetical protein
MSREQEQTVFPDVQSFLQIAFPGHTIVVESEEGQTDKYFLDEAKPENEIYVPNFHRKGKRMYSLHLLSLSMSKRYSELSPEDAKPGKEAEFTSFIDKQKARVDECLAKLRDLTGHTNDHFSPALHHCSKCGVVAGGPGTGHENTIGQQPLAGHRGTMLLCRNCGKTIGTDPDGIHCYS